MIGIGIWLLKMKAEKDMEEKKGIKIRGTNYQKAKENLEAYQNRIENIEETEIKDVEIIEENDKPTNRKREYTAEEKRAYAIRQREIKEQKKIKGQEYEKYVAKQLRILGFYVYENGRYKGRNDQGIDLIASKNGELNLIQCKNWNAENKYRIDHEKIKAFIGSTTCFMEDNPELNHMSLKRLYVISEPILDKSAILFINQNKDKVKYLHLPMPS